MVMHCKWLKLGTIELCNTKTKNEYCDKPNHKQYIPSCKSCDVGTKSKELICTQCNNYEESRYKCKICNKKMRSCTKYFLCDEHWGQKRLPYMKSFIHMQHMKKLKIW